MAEVICWKCGSKNRSEAKFCSSCGYDMSTATPEIFQEKRTKRRWASVISAVLLLFQVLLNFWQGRTVTGIIMLIVWCLYIIYMIYVLRTS
jgi:hypothetical protein